MIHPQPDTLTHPVPLGSRRSRAILLAWAALAILLASAGPALSAPGEPAGGGVRLLWFTSANCGPCQQIRPHVERMAADRLPVFKVDTASRPDLMSRYRVSGVPTFVLEVNGREAWRGVGVPGGDARGTAERMRGRLTAALADARRAAASRAAASRAEVARAQSPRAAPTPNGRTKTSEVPLTLARAGDAPAEKKRGFFDFLKPGRDEEPVTLEDPFPPTPDDSFGRPAAPPADPAPLAAAFGGGSPTAAATGDLPPADPERDPMRATVRIHVTDDDAVERGSGTVIASRPGRSVALTCGHLFKQYRPGDRIRAESFATGTAVPFEATLIGFDPAADVGLIAMETPRALPAAALSPDVLVVGDRVVSTGCDGGGNPTRQNHLVQSVGRFAGPANFTCTGQPRQGRSGGGCFDAAGRVVGLVWSVSKEPPEGVYAGLPAVFDLLDRHGLGALKPVGPPSAPQSAAPLLAGAAADADLVDALFADADPAPARTASLDPAPAAAGPARVTPAGAVEITCVIRSVDDPSAPSEILVINRATPRTLALLRGAAVGEPTPTSLRRRRRPAATKAGRSRGGSGKRAGGAAPGSVCRPAAARR